MAKTNFNGDARVVVKVTDESDSSAEFTLSVIVTAINDVPVVDVDGEALVYYIYQFD